MGNASSKKGFKTQGHVLGTAVPPASGNSSSSAKPPAAKPPAAWPASSKAARAAPPSQAQVEERRRNAAEAAAARERAWDERVARQRAKRCTPVPESSSASSSSEPLSGPRGPQVAMDPALARKREADALKLQDLEKSGFNPYQARIESAAGARSALVLDQHVAPAPPATTKRSESDFDADDMTRARRQLVAAMSASAADKEVLRLALSDARRFEVPEVEEAAELLQALDLAEAQDDAVDVEGVDGAWAVFVQSPDSKQDMAATVNTIVKLMKNLDEHPEDARFRAIRLENRTIADRLVSPCGGTALNVLEAVGFERVGEVMVVPDPVTLDRDVVLAARTRIRRLLDLCEHWLREYS